MFYVTDSLDLSVLQEAELTMLVTNLSVLQEIMRDEDIQSFVTQPINAKMLSKVLRLKIAVNKAQLTADKIRKGDKVLLLETEELPDKISGYLYLAIM